MCVLQTQVSYIESGKSFETFSSTKIRYGSNTVLYSYSDISYKISVTENFYLIMTEE